MQAQVGQTQLLSHMLPSNRGLPPAFTHQHLYRRLRHAATTARSRGCYVGHPLRPMHSLDGRMTHRLALARCRNSADDRAHSSTFDEPQRQRESLGESEIQRRIHEHHARKLAKSAMAVRCPACDILLWAPKNVPAHVASCCPDLVEYTGGIAVWKQAASQSEKLGDELVESSSASSTSPGSSVEKSIPPPSGSSSIAATTTAATAEAPPAATTVTAATAEATTEPPTTTTIAVAEASTNETSGAQLSDPTQSTAAAAIAFTSTSTYLINSSAYSPAPSTSVHNPLSPLIAMARDEEERLRKVSLDWTFRTGELDEGGMPRRLGAEEVSGKMQLPKQRVANLVAHAMRAYPMVADDEPVEVLFEDEHLIAVNKPFGAQTAPVHRFRGGSMVNRLIHYLGGKEPLVLHRLDTDTSGMLLFAKTKLAVSKVSAQFRNRTMKKCYLALCMGVPSPAIFTVDHAIGAHPSVPYARCAVSNEEDPEAKPASTSFLVVSANPSVDLSAASATPGELFKAEEHGRLLLPRAEGGGGAALVACAPHTGRTHQIRLHMQAAGHPLIGDEVYGANIPWIQRQALHSVALSFTHPISKEEMTLTAPIHADFAAALRQCGLPQPDLAGLPGMMATICAEEAKNSQAPSGGRSRSRRHSK